MTRKRTRESLEQLLHEPCPHCDGLGRLRSVETLAYDALRRLTRAAAEDGGGLVLVVHPVVAAVLQADCSQHVRAVATRFGRAARVEARPDFARDEIRIERERYLEGGCLRHPPACPRARGRCAAVLRWASREPHSVRPPPSLRRPRRADPAAGTLGGSSYDERGPVPMALVHATLPPSSST